MDASRFKIAFVAFSESMRVLFYVSSTGVAHSSEAHETSLRDVETDDAMAFIHFVDGGFLCSYFLAWGDVWVSSKHITFGRMNSRRNRP